MFKAIWKKEEWIIIYGNFLFSNWSYVMSEPWNTWNRLLFWLNTHIVISFNISVNNLPDLSSVVHLDPPTEERSLRLFFALISILVENKKPIVYMHNNSVRYKGINIMRIAIPSNNPGGLEASRSDH